MPDPIDIFNPNNPYDVYNLDLSYLYEDLEIVFQDPNLTLNQLDIEIENILDSNSNIVYPSVVTEYYTTAEAEILNDFIEEADLSNIGASSLFVENQVLNSTVLNMVQKDRLLSLISQYKYNYLYYSSYLYNTTLKAIFDGCMRREAGEIFNDDNPVDDFLFISGIPYSFFGMAAYCAYEALLG